MNWKRFLSKPKVFIAGLIVAIPLVALAAASIRWYNDPAIPQKVTLDGAEVMSLQQTAPNAYRWALMSDVREYMGGSAGSPVTIIYATTINVTTNYITNAIITYLTVVSNAYFYETNFVNYEIVTNLTVINDTRVGKLTVNSNAFITNVYFLTSRSEDIAWAGPTNEFNFVAGSLQNYTTFTPVSITNVVGATNGFGNSALLCITNAADSNVTITVTASGWLPAYGETTTYTASNASIFELWLLEASGRKTIATRGFK